MGSSPDFSLIGFNHKFDPGPVQNPAEVWGLRAAAIAALLSPCSHREEFGSLHTRRRPRLSSHCTGSVSTGSSAIRVKSTSAPSIASLQRDHLASIHLSGSTDRESAQPNETPRVHKTKLRTLAHYLGKFACSLLLNLSHVFYPMVVTTNHKPSTNHKLSQPKQSGEKSHAIHYQFA